MKLFYIFIGSGLGGICRYALNKFISSYYSNIFPIGTLIVNILACFIVGVLVGFTINKSFEESPIKLLGVIGFCGGFSTFSSFSFETLTLLQNNSILVAFSYIIFSVVLCLIATYFGMLLIHKFI
jgi:CrcB protein